MDKGVCYYCGFRPQPGVRLQSDDHVVAPFDLSALDPLCLAIDALTDCYSRVPDDMRAEMRPKYQLAVATLRPVVDALKDVKQRNKE